jgi:hypothetical protein
MAKKKRTSTRRRRRACSLGSFKAPRGCGWKVEEKARKGKGPIFLLVKDGESPRRFFQECLAKSVLKGLCQKDRTKVSHA